MPTTLRIVIVLAIVFGFLLSGAAVRRADAIATWDVLADDYLDQILFRFNPSYGTSVGLHQYDSQLEDYSRASIDKEVAALQQFEQPVVSFDASALSSIDAADREMLLGAIRAHSWIFRSFVPGKKIPIVIPGPPTMVCMSS